MSKPESTASIAYGFRGKHVVVTGAASGMGAAARDLLVAEGAHVHCFDLQPITGPAASSRQMDLADPASVDAAVAGVDTDVDAILNCAGVPSNFPAETNFRVNFLGTRRFTEGLLDRLRPGGAVANIASKAGMAWQSRLPLHRELLAIEDDDEALAWMLECNQSLAEPYPFSKEAIIAYTMKRAGELAAEGGRRMNALCPGATDTPMMRDHFMAYRGEETMKAAVAHVGRQATALEMAHPLLFLASPAASYVSGVSMIVDHGQIGGYLLGVLQGPDRPQYEQVRAATT